MNKFLNDFLLKSLMNGDTAKSVEVVLL